MATPVPPPSAMKNASSNSSSRGPAVGDDDDGATNMTQLLSSVLQDRSAEGGAPPKTVSSVPGDSCTWYANKQCATARTCYDCLNTRLAGNTQICMVDNYGMCVSMSQYKPDKDFRRARPPNTIGATGNLYPSTNATYCANNDPYCAVCKDSWGNPFDNSQLSYLPFCRGSGGCVCIQACESPYHNDNVIMQRCVAYGFSAPSASTIYTSIGFMAALCVVVAIVTLVVRRWIRRSRAHARPAFRHDVPLPQREPTGPRLGLSGWHSMREKLIETEREQLHQNADNLVPVIDSTTASSVSVESEDSYVPVSRATQPASHTQAIPENDSENGDDSQLRRRASSEPTTRSAGTATRPLASVVNEL